MSTAPTTRTPSTVHPFVWLLGINGVLWVLAHQVARIAFDGPPFLQGIATLVFWSYAAMSAVLFVLTGITGVRLAYRRIRKEGVQ